MLFSIYSNVFPLPSHEVMPHVYLSRNTGAILKFRTSSSCQKRPFVLSDLYIQQRLCKRMADREKSHPHLRKMGFFFLVACKLPFGQLSQMDGWSEAAVSQLITLPNECRESAFCHKGERKRRDGAQDGTNQTLVYSGRETPSASCFDPAF